ncbi:hypothetical protein [Budvicia aquatica]|uniref:Uncharacterized protein n=1 Tax=Budvicia aquatica TaxID=82979 RepID=A0A484ZGU1_9GAMM|nr:hypothetical protein [Budvicia aquatica]VFS47710.1 Uncharacterised protein [Budvicia aquatica]
MVEAAQKTPQKRDKKKDSISTSSMEFLNSRQSKDIYLGLCGYVGCGMRTINEIAEEISKEWDYNVVHIRISALLESPLYFELKALTASKSTQVNRHLKLQDIANKLRKHYNRNELLAEAAIAAIATEKINIDYTNDAYKGTVFIIDQFKRPEEVELFRVIYQHNFYLLGVLRDLDYRIPNLIADESTKDDLHLIINIDNKSSHQHGQRTGETILDSDFFIKNNFSQKSELKKKIERFFGLIHGKNGLTPTFNEKACTLLFQHHYNQLVCRVR